MSHPLEYLSNELNFFGRFYFCPLTVSLEPGSPLIWSKKGLILPYLFTFLMGSVSQIMWLGINPDAFLHLVGFYSSSKTDLVVFFGLIGLNSILTVALIIIAHKSSPRMIDLYQGFRGALRDSYSSKDYRKVYIGKVLLVCKKNENNFFFSF